MLPFFFRMSRELRSRGRWDFIFHYGLLRFGLAVGIVTVLDKYVEHYGLTLDGLRSTEFLLYAVMWFLFMAVGAGWAFGALFWRFGAGDEDEPADGRSPP